MSYQSPIDIIQTQMRSYIDDANKQLQNQVENNIYKAVIQVGIDVDKDELVKALAYDRRQYQKGYNDRDREIVRCKECSNSKKWLDNKRRCFLWNDYGVIVSDDDFCSRPIRSDTENN